MLPEDSHPLPGRIQLAARYCSEPLEFEPNLLIKVMPLTPRKLLCMACLAQHLYTTPASGDTEAVHYDLYYPFQNGEGEASPLPLLDYLTSV